jgi:competence protein ComEA
VTNPAVYELSPGAILEEAVNIAGGFSSEADPSAVNLALVLNNGMHVHIPIEGAAPVVTNGDSNVSMQQGNINGLININTATLEELDSLPGIGPSTAQKIIDYRLANGPFQTIEDIDMVSGIGPAKLENLRDGITVQ